MHMPPDGPPTPFTIGLRPLADDDWIVVDAELGAYLAEKARLAVSGATVFAAEPGTEAAQAEVLAMLADHLPARFPQVYRRQGQVIAILPAGKRVALDGDAPPLAIAGSLVQEDLVLMRRGAAGWRLAAASLSFPSYWRLEDKIGRPLDAVHAPVPGFGAGTRNATLIERIFDNLKTEIPVKRWNWTVHADAALHHPERRHGPGMRFGAAAENAFIRVERQTLRKLPGSGDVLFTIRTFIDPLAVLTELPGGAALANSLADKLAALDAAQLAYRELEAARDVLVTRLRAMTGG